MTSFRRMVLAFGLSIPFSARAEVPTPEESEAAFVEECVEGEGVYLPPGECEEIAQRSLAIRRMRLALIALRGGTSASDVVERYGLTEEELEELELEQARLAEE